MILVGESKLEAPKKAFEFALRIWLASPLGVFEPLGGRAFTHRRAQLVWSAQIGVTLFLSGQPKSPCSA